MDETHETPDDGEEGESSGDRVQDHDLGEVSEDRRSFGVATKSTIHKISSRIPINGRISPKRTPSDPNPKKGQKRNTALTLRRPGSH